MNDAFHTTPLAINDWLICIGLASVVLWADEPRKLLQQCARAADQELSGHAGANRGRALRKHKPAPGAGFAQAADGTRTHDLLHGNRLHNPHKCSVARFSPESDYRGLPAIRSLLVPQWSPAPLNAEEEFLQASGMSPSLAIAAREFPRVACVGYDARSDRPTERFTPEVRTVALDRLPPSALGAVPLSWRNGPAEGDPWRAPSLSSSRLAPASS